MNFTKKNQLNNFFRVFVILLIILLITNCQKDDVVIENNLQQNNYISAIKKSRKVSADEIPEIINFLDTKTKGVFNNTKSSNYGNLDFDDILEVIDTLENKNYTFNITNVKQDQNTKTAIYNLIIHTDTNNVYEPYVLKYELDTDFVLKYLNKTVGFDSFTGNIQMYSIDSFLSTYQLDDTKNGDDPCPSIEVTDSTTNPAGGGNNTGGEGNPNGGTTTSTGSNGGSGGSSCTIEYVYEAGPCGDPISRNECLFLVAINIYCSMKSGVSAKMDDDGGPCPNPQNDGTIGILPNLSPSAALIALLGDSYTIDIGEGFSLLNDQPEIQQNIITFLNANTSQQAIDFAIAAIDALMNNQVVVFDLNNDDLYNGNPIDYSKLTNSQRVATVVMAIKRAVENNDVESFDINAIFYNLPTVNVNIVAKVFVNNKLLEIRLDFGVYDNLVIDKFPNNYNQYYLVGGIGNYSITGYWSVFKFRSFGNYGNGADALFLYVKDSAQYDYTNGDFLREFLGY